jgi:hypothetical protein
MRLDEHWRMHWSPIEFLDLAYEQKRRLINQYLLRTTPLAFPSYQAYYDFLEDVAARFNVPPHNVVLRGSCLIGFSITPDNDKLWQNFDDESDLDLAIVDAALYDDTERRVSQWERTNRAGEVGGPASERFEKRQQDRYFQCCRLHDLPAHLSGHYRDTAQAIADRCHSGIWREVKAFIYRDWWAIRGRYESDLRNLCKGVDEGRLLEPGETPFPRYRTSGGAERKRRG